MGASCVEGRWVAEADASTKALILSSDRRERPSKEEGRWSPRLVVRRTVAARPAHHEALSLATPPGSALNPGECRGEMRRAWMWRGDAFCV